MKTRLLFVITLLILAPVGVYALNARIEMIDGEILMIKDFSMEGKQHFYVEWKGGTSTLDWKGITSFEILRKGQNYWVDVLFLEGNKDSFKLRQSYSFRGRLDFGQWSVPFEKVKKVELVRTEKEEKKKDEILMKETDVPPYSIPKEVDKITLKNGDMLHGNISAETISIRTNYGTFSFKKSDILRLAFGTPGKTQKEKELDMLYSKFGDKLTGTISAPQINVALLTGTNLSILREHIKEIEFGIMMDSEQKTLQEKWTESAPQKSYE